MRQSIRLDTLRGVTVGLRWSALVMLGLLAKVLAVSGLPTAAGGNTIPAYCFASGGSAATGRRLSARGVRRRPPRLTVAVGLGLVLTSGPEPCP